MLLFGVIVCSLAAIIMLGNAAMIFFYAIKYRLVGAVFFACMVAMTGLLAIAVTLDLWGKM